MHSLKLFLGLPVNPDLEKALADLDDARRALFLGKHEYLEELSDGGQSYLGKFLSSYPDVEELKDLEKHVLSLVSLLLPRYSSVLPPIQLKGILACL